MEDSNFRKGDAKTAIFGSEKMLQASPVDKIPDGPTTPEIAYQMVKDETFAQTQPRLNLATFVTTYMDDYATKLMNEAININYIDETEYPRIAVMNAKCINIVANLWNTPEQAKWKAGALAIGSSEACMLGGVAAWLRWRKKRQAAGKPVDKPNFVISTGFQVVWEKFAQLWQIEMRQVPLTLEKTGEVVHARQVVGAHVLLQHEAVHRRRRAERGQLVVLDLLQQLRGHELVHVVGEDGGAGDPLAVDLAPAELRPAAVGHAHVQRVLLHLLPVLRGDDVA